VEPSLAGVPGVDNSQILLVALTAVNSASMSVADTLVGHNSENENENYDDDDDDDECKSHVDVGRALELELDGRGKNKHQSSVSASASVVPTLPVCKLPAAARRHLWVGPLVLASATCPPIQTHHHCCC
jgi:hypothetical protein